jgi:SPW repeat-containing protein
VWLIVSPWLVSGVSTSTGMILSNVIVGAVVVVLGAAGMAMAMTRRGNHR